MSTFALLIESEYAYSKFGGFNWKENTQEHPLRICFRPFYRNKLKLCINKVIIVRVK